MLEKYIRLVKLEKAYVGNGKGQVLDYMRAEIRALQNKLKAAGVLFPQYEDIANTIEGWE